MEDALVELESEIGRGVQPAELDRIVLRTRPAKTHTPAAQLVGEWRQRAAGLGLDPKALRSVLGLPEPVVPPDDVIHDVLAGPGGVCEGTSVFDMGDVVHALADLPLPGEDGTVQPFLGGAERIRAIARSFVRSAHVVRLVDGPRPLFTTREMLDAQERIASRFRASHLGVVGGADSAAIEAALAAHAHLTAEQRALVRSWCAGDRYLTAIGRAGAGKTTTVAACTDAWASSGWRVVGSAVKGEAARTLAAATGVPCETVAWYLAHDDPHDLPVDARTVLVVDEASTLSDRDLDALMTMVETTGARLRLIGDPAQHSAVAPGGMFRVLCERHPDRTPELRTTHRTAHADDRAAAEALREGRVEEALDRLAAAGHLHIASDELDLTRSVLTRWWEAHQAGDHHPMVDRRNDTRRRLNHLAHLLLWANGEVGHDELVASGDRRFSVGDRVAARRPARDLHVDGNRRAYVRNGARGTVRVVQADALDVDFEGIGRITVPMDFLDGSPHEPGLDHAYALTSYAVQGATHAVSTSRIDPTSSRAEAYVDITRGRTANHLYATARRVSLDGEELARAAPTPADEAVTARLRRSTGETTAYEVVHSAEPYGGTARSSISL